ncbi:MAG: DUF6011 domain-containing protein [Streptosporangiaceae bacterium]
MTESTQTVKCQGCGRKLTATASVAAGRGPVCRARPRKAAATADLGAFHGWQVDKAREAIEMLAVIPSSRPGLYAVVSSDGVTVYLADAIERSCTCKAAASARRCYHLASAVILAAASRRAA